MTQPAEQVTISGDTVRVHVEFEVTGKSRYRDALVMTQAEYNAWSKKPKAQRDADKRARYDAWVAFVEEQSKKAAELVVEEPAPTEEP